jgi:hypothetical protein
VAVEVIAGSVTWFTVSTPVFGSMHIPPKSSGAAATAVVNRSIGLLLSEVAAEAASTTPAMLASTTAPTVAIVRRRSSCDAVDDVPPARADARPTRTTPIAAHRRALSGIERRVSACGRPTVGEAEDAG